MAKKNSKQKENSITGERQFGVILEDIDSKLDLVVEGHKALDEKIDKNHGEFQEFKKKLTINSALFLSILNKLTGALNKSIGALNSRSAL